MNNPEIFVTPSPCSHSFDFRMRIDGGWMKEPLFVEVTEGDSPPGRFLPLNS